MQLERLELREIGLKLKYPFQTSFETTTHRRIILVRVFDQSGAVGYGECVAPEGPFFNHECVDAAWVIMTRFVAPLLAQARVQRAEDVSLALDRIRGNQMAKGGVETAVWDLEAKLAGQPLGRHIGGTLTEINCGVSIGIQPTIEVLLDKVQAELDAGYQRIKIKIKPGQDVKLVEAVRGRHPNILLSVDANSAYRLDKDVELLKQLDRYNLLMMEQPLTPGDLLDHAKLQKQLKTAICLDESITCLKDARDAVELGSCRIINIKLGRVGGHREARAIQKFAQERKIPVWCGGMLESGVGRAHNIAMSTLSGFILPGDVSASARYWDEDIIDPPVTVSKKGTIVAPAGPGLGYQVSERRVEALTVRKEKVKLA